MKKNKEVLGSRRLCIEIRKREEDWTGIENYRERKKLQNRLNQRARRRRETTLTTKKPSKKSYHVDRWRISDHAGPVEPRTRSSQSMQTWEVTNDFSTQVQSQVMEGIQHDQTSHSFIDTSPAILEFSQATSFPLPTSTLNQFAGSQVSSVAFPLSSDHLIHLIHYNVLRAISINKSILGATTSLIKAGELVPLVPSTIDLCDGLTLICILDQGLPSALYPTSLQGTYAHPSWMNSFPCASIRDNLIAYAGVYNEVDLLNDIFGGYISDSKSLSPGDLPCWFSVESAIQPPLIDIVDDSEDVTAERNGLIVWGEPWNVENWEVTPGFVRKWGRLLDGCDQLIAASNRWRALREEEPLWRVIEV